MNFIAPFWTHLYVIVLWSKPWRTLVLDVSCWARVPVMSAESFSPDCWRNLAQARCWPAQARCRAEEWEKWHRLRTRPLKQHWLHEVIQLRRFYTSTIHPDDFAYTGSQYSFKASENTFKDNKPIRNNLRNFLKQQSKLMGRREQVLLMLTPIHHPNTVLMAQKFFSAFCWIL
jgi:hypothetical protein